MDSTLNELLCAEQLVFKSTISFYLFILIIKPGLFYFRLFRFVHLCKISLLFVNVNIQAGDKK